MGTNIDVLFQRPARLDAVAITRCLNADFEKCESALRVIKQYAWYSCDCNPWNIEHVPANDGEPEYLHAEGPYGFDISVYGNTICLGHLERFGRLHYDDSPVAISLQRVLTTIVEDLAGAVPFACVAGGMGDSDQAIDLAYYQTSPFPEVANWLRQFLGEPAQTWSELNGGTYRWALIGSPQ